MHYLLNLGVFIRLFALINRHQGYPFFFAWIQPLYLWKRVFFYRNFCNNILSHTECGWWVDFKQWKYNLC